MAYTPFATEFAIPYTLTGPAPSNVVAVLNDPASPNYVGMLQEITGLDSAEVRESASELVEADGGAHGRFYFGRRPVTMTIKVVNNPSALVRAQRIDRLHRAAQGLRGDAMLTWAPSYAPTVGMQLPVRLQQPIRDTGAWNKDIQLALVSELAVIQSQTLRASASIASGGAGVTIENVGSYPSYPLIEITGAATNPAVTSSTGGTVYTGPTGYTLTLVAGETIQIDALNHSATFIAGPRNGQNANRFINFASTVTWPSLITGNNTFTLTGGGTAVIRWRDSWH